MITIKTAIKIGLALFVALLAIGASPVVIAICVAVYALGVLFFIPDNSPVPPVATPQTIIEPPDDHVEPPVFHHPGPDVFITPPTQSRFAGLELGPSIPQWIAQSKTLGARVAELIATQATQLGALYRAKYDDVLLTNEQAQFVTTAYGAGIRHGLLIEKVILQTLKDCKRYRAWDAKKLATDEASDDEGGHRKMDVDLVVFDTEKNCVTGYEVKRNTANAQDVERKLKMAEPLLIREAEVEGLYIATKASVAVISWYGGFHRSPKSTFPYDVITRETIDQHFGCAIRAEVESATEKLRAELQGLFAHAGNDRRAA